MLWIRIRLLVRGCHLTLYRTGKHTLWLACKRPYLLCIGVSSQSFWSVTLRCRPACRSTATLFINETFHLPDSDSPVFQTLLLLFNLCQRAVTAAAPRVFFWLFLHVVHIHTTVVMWVTCNWDLWILMRKRRIMLKQLETAALWDQYLFLATKIIYIYFLTFPMTTSFILLCYFIVSAMAMAMDSYRT